MKNLKPSSLAITYECKSEAPARRSPSCHLARILPPNSVWFFGSNESSASERRKAEQRSTGCSDFKSASISQLAAKLPSTRSPEKGCCLGSIGGVAEAASPSEQKNPRPVLSVLFPCLMYSYDQSFRSKKRRAIRPQSTRASCAFSRFIESCSSSYLAQAISNNLRPSSALLRRCCRFSVV